jgi:hypothetical protein
MDQLEKDTSIKLGDVGQGMRIRRLSNQLVEVTLNKYYTIFGQFMSFGAGK